MTSPEPSNHSASPSAFDQLRDCLDRVAPPSVDGSRVPESAYPALLTLHEEFTDLHSRTLKSVASMRLAWPYLSNSEPAAAPSDVVSLGSLNLPVFQSKDAEKDSRIEYLEAKVRELEGLAASASKDASELRDRAAQGSVLMTPLGASEAPRAADSVDAECVAGIRDGINRRNEEKLKQIFNKLKDASGGLSGKNMIAALREAHAPIIPRDETEAAEVMKQFDWNGNPSLDFGKFQQVVSIPDDLQLWFSERQLPFAADALRPLVNKLLPQDESERVKDQLKALNQLSPSDIQRSATAFCSVFPEMLKTLHEELNVSFNAQSKMAAAVEADAAKAAMGEPTKFGGFYKASCGSVSDFHKGIAGRVGLPQLNFMKAMRQEHCERAGCDVEFVTSNYKIRTTPKNEWNYIVNGVAPPDQDMGHGRTIVPIQELFEMSKKAKMELIEEEVIAIVLYTGPMFYVYNAILRRFPLKTETDFSVSIFEKGDNLYSTTIFVLVSAIQKLCRRTRIPEGMLVYRGMGGRMDLPDIFFQTDEYGRSGYAEWGFLSTTANRDIALQYSGVKEGLPKAMVMVIETSSIDRGASLAEFSQYPEEREFLYLPCSFIQRTRPGNSRVQVLDDGLVVFVYVKVNLNIRTQTVEELRDQKRSMHLVSARSIAQEVNIVVTEWISSKLQQGIDLNHYVGDVSKFKEGFISQCKQLIDAHDKKNHEDYADDATYRQMITEVLDLKGVAVETTKWQETRMRLRDHDFRSAKLGTTLHGHNHYVNVVAFHPTEPILASCSDDCTVKLWRFRSDAAEATNILTWKAHDDSVKSVAFDPNATILATGSQDKTVKLWMLNDKNSIPNCLATLKGHKDSVNSVAFYPTDCILVSGSEDKTIKLWLLKPDNWKKFECLATLNGHEGSVDSIAIHPASPFLASGSEDATVKLWRFAKGSKSAKCVATLEGHGTESGEARVAENGNDGRDEDEEEDEEEEEEEESDGNAEDDEDDEEEDDEEEDDEEEGCVNAVAFHPTQPILASGSDDATVRLWRFSFDIAGPQTPSCFAILRGHVDYVLSVAFHPTEPILASGGCEDDKSVRLWRLGENSATCFGRLKGHSDSVMSVAFHPTAPILATGSSDNSTKLWR
jgi:WD40 repeat protein